MGGVKLDIRNLQTGVLIYQRLCPGPYTQNCNSNVHTCQFLILQTNIGREDWVYPVGYISEKIELGQNILYIYLNLIEEETKTGV